MEKSLLFLVLLPLLTALSFPGFNTGNRPSGMPVLSASVKTAQEEKTCTDCHSDLIESSRVHGPAATSCASCHTIDITDHIQNGPNGLNLTSKLPVLCYNCHEDLKTSLETTKGKHKALDSENSCTACHSPHSSDVKGILIAEQKKLCLSCHNRDISESGMRTANIKKIITTNPVVHPPVAAGNCTVCHQPHASENNYLLIGAFPRGNYAPANKDSYAVCWECHDTDLFDLEKTTTATNFRDGERNLHFVHLNGKKSRTCVMCHDVHAAPNQHLIQDKVVFGGWELPLRYKSTEKGGSCFPGCHGSKEYTNQ
jgi:predicted CXXCH cytochrome family protein